MGVLRTTYVGESFLMQECGNGHSYRVPPLVGQPGSPTMTRAYSPKDRAIQESYRGLATWLRRERESRGLTKRRLADKLRVTPAAVSNWEHKRAGISRGMMLRIVEVFGVEPPGVRVKS